MTIALDFDSASAFVPAFRPRRDWFAALRALFSRKTPPKPPWQRSRSNNERAPWLEHSASVVAEPALLGGFDSHKGMAGTTIPGDTDFQNGLRALKIKPITPYGKRQPRDSFVCLEKLAADIKPKPLDDIATLVRKLTYGEMMDYAAGILKAQGVEKPSETELAAAANTAHKWATGAA